VHLRCAEEDRLITLCSPRLLSSAVVLYGIEFVLSLSFICGKIWFSSNDDEGERRLISLYSPNPLFGLTAAVTVIGVKGILQCSMIF